MFQQPLRATIQVLPGDHLRLAIDPGQQLRHASGG
jgi:hypothetical protein